MAAKPLQAPSQQNPRQAFEDALATMRQSKGRSSLGRRNVPAPHQPLISPSQCEIEKRALADAAKALAQLWKLSPNLVR